jgi:dihydroneopterin aldolase/2-amino-4-hydroxy-6-hydroxymethyldihydropteridine diphosphokinase/dihydropteroate synthase
MDHQQQHPKGAASDAVELPMNDKICIRDLTVRNIIGVDAWERSKRQPIIINLVVYTSVSQAGDTDHLVRHLFPYRKCR